MRRQRQPKVIVVSLEAAQSRPGGTRDTPTADARDGAGGEIERRRRLTINMCAVLIDLLGPWDDAI